MFIGNVTVVMPVIPMVSMIAGQIPTITNMTPCVSPINTKITAIAAWIITQIPAYTILSGIKMKLNPK